MIMILLNEVQRQVVILALAHLAVERPEWDVLLLRIVSELNGYEMYVEFKRLHERSHAQLRTW